jgi:F0F1-type ATP synthase delta subunit
MELKLPLSVVNKGDLARLMRELDSLELSNQSVASLPNLSLSLSKLLEINNITALDEKSIIDLVLSLDELKNRGIQVHLSFASNPSAANVEKVLGWLRSNINGLLLLQVGLRPDIAAGCVLNTGSKVYDFTISSRLDKKFDILAKSIHSITDQAEEASNV